MLSTQGERLAGKDVRYRITSLRRAEAVLECERCHGPINKGMLYALYRLDGIEATPSGEREELKLCVYCGSRLRQSMEDSAITHP
jgi:hypothetical protein